MDLKFIIIIVMLIGIGLLLLGELHAIRREFNEKISNLEKEVEKNNNVIYTKIQNDTLDTINKIKFYNDELITQQKKLLSFEMDPIINTSHNHYSDRSANSSRRLSQQVKEEPFKITFTNDIKSKSSNASSKKEATGNITIDKPFKITTLDIYPTLPPSPSLHSLPGKKNSVSECPSVPSTCAAINDIDKLTYEELKVMAKKCSIPLTHVVNGVRKYLRKNELYEKINTRQFLS